ncbi:GSCOCG00005946001-RA-CDS [Cotesia congregata]|nr:GSCOCG00005946001-RA-CDS [Cotesia congregata]
MVAAGVTDLMAANEGSSSSDSLARRSRTSTTNSIIGKKTASIRETKASRLRAASIVSPIDGSTLPRKTGFPDGLSAWSSQSATLYNKQKSPMSSSSSSLSQASSRDRDKYYQRRTSTKSSEPEDKLIDSANSERIVRRSKRLALKASATKTSSALSDLNKNPLGVGRYQNSDSKDSTRRVSNHQSTSDSVTVRASSTSTSTTLASSSGTKRTSTNRISGHDSSEVLQQRVDALTARTRATMERVERLASSSSSSPSSSHAITPVDSRSTNLRLGDYHTSGIPQMVTSRSPNITKQPPKNVRVLSTDTSASSFLLTTNNLSSSTSKTINNEVQVISSTVSSSRSQSALISILKHKSLDIETTTADESRQFVTLAVDNIKVNNKKHGILKKRSSLDENEILRRRNNSPDVYAELSSLDYLPISSNERRSSLDELVKRPRSPESHLTSILKRKTSGEDDREEFYTTEPQSILKRPSSGGCKLNSAGHHVSIAAAVAKTLGNTEFINGGACTQVRPILKKKISREESSSSDPPSLEPRPILKKKSSTESDEHEDKPKKTILKSSKKSSEDSSNESEATSPKKLSVLKNRALQRRTNSLPECDAVRSILKNSSSGRSRSSDSTRDLCLRKRARSVGHENTSHGNWNEMYDTFKDSIDVDCRPTPISSSLRCNNFTSSIAPIVSFKLPSREDEVIYCDSNAEDSAANDDEKNLTNINSNKKLDDNIVKLRRARHISQELDSSTLENRRQISTGGGRNVSQMALRFKAMEEERVKTTSVKESKLPRHNNSHQQRLRNDPLGQPHSKDLYDRFVTQPVTYQEVHEAVLLNQGISRPSGEMTSVSSTRKQDSKSDDVDPSKLSLADRVKLFNRRIDTENTGKSGVTLDRTQRRLNSRFRTQPVTVEEVEVASRNIPSKIDNLKRVPSESLVSDITTSTKNQRPVSSVPCVDFPSMSIADRLAALQRSGTTDWKRRVTTETKSSDLCQKEKDELAIKQRRLADRLEKLESAAEGWRKRVVETDAITFSVAGKMRVELPDSILPQKLFESMGNCVSDAKKKVPRPEYFRKGNTKDMSDSNEYLTQPTLPKDTSDDSGMLTLTQIHLFSLIKREESTTNRKSCSIHYVPRADDETFTSFFESLSVDKCREESIDVDESDFDVITPYSELLGVRRTTKFQRRHVSSRNPIKILAARTDIKDEYTEINTGVAERVMKMTNIEKLAQNSNLAVEALAGLASTENFNAITLKNVTDSTIFGSKKLRPYKELMLILVKGRRHVQVRLVEPVALSVNSGDNYILVTRSELYHYSGKFSNVIEKSRAADIALRIQRHKDLGCHASQVITINEGNSTSLSDVKNFWKHLGESDINSSVVEAGLPEEDELYESALIATNVVYEVVNDELIPLEKYWGAIPKIKILDPSKILVFDFGSEMYIWHGKIASKEKRSVATRLAQELWDEGYDYSECTACPIDAASLIGRRPTELSPVKKDVKRPEWCLIAKLTQHTETILFREKFLDWPNATGIIKVKKSQEKEQVDGKIIVDPPDVNLMLQPNDTPVDLILEGCHLGRGSGWFDEEFSRQYLVTTTNVTVWNVDEYSYSQLDDSSVGQFFTGDSYIVRWMYRITITGRELSGLPSKHAVDGRNRCAYFIWQGKNSSLNQQGTAALLTVELDGEKGPHIRVVEGSEPAAFFNLFKGGMVVHSGKKSDKRNVKKLRIFVSRGAEENETCLIEELYQVNQPSLFLLDNKDELWLWQGWWPDTGLDDQTGSGAVRWQAERKAAMTVAIEYWNKTHSNLKKKCVYLIWAGLEPLEFINLFPTWTDRDDIAELNMEDGRAPGEILSVESELARLTQRTYPPAQLLQRPLPAGVDPTTLELYLSPQHFTELLGMNMEEFRELPAWKQISIKKKIGLF